MADGDGDVDGNWERREPTTQPRHLLLFLRPRSLSLFSPTRESDNQLRAIWTRASQEPRQYVVLLSVATWMEPLVSKIARYLANTLHIFGCSGRKRVSHVST
jgi:hypothetical protein